MPIYEYQCANCGHHVEVLQKVNEEPLRRCAACGEDALNKIISMTSFQLKGSGWYKAPLADNSGKESSAAGASKKTETSEKTEAGSSAAPKDSDKPVSAESGTSTTKKES